MRRVFCDFGALSDCCCRSSGLMFSINAALNVCSTPVDAYYELYYTLYVPIKWIYVIHYIPLNMLMCGQFCSSFSCLDQTRPGTFGGPCPFQGWHLERWIEQEQWMVHQFGTFAERLSKGSLERKWALSFPVRGSCSVCFEILLSNTSGLMCAHGSLQKNEVAYGEFTLVPA